MGLNIIGYDKNAVLQYQVDILNKKLRSLEYENREANNRLNSTIKKLKQNDITISQHAVDRFIERIAYVSNKTAKHILSSSKIKNRSQKNGKYYHNDTRYKLSFTYVVENKCIITVYSNDKRKSPTIEDKLNSLEHYMNYYIDGLVEKYSNNEVSLAKFKNYLKDNWILL